MKSTRCCANPAISNPGSSVRSASPRQRGRASSAPDTSPDPASRPAHRQRVEQNLDAGGGFLQSASPSDFRTSPEDIAPPDARVPKVRYGGFDRYRPFAWPARPQAIHLQGSRIHSGSDSTSLYPVSYWGAGPRWVVDDYNSVNDLSENYLSPESPSSFPGSKKLVPVRLVEFLQLATNKSDFLGIFFTRQFAAHQAEA
jgi:hypothetical protein